ncbi:hypothetical protein HY632_01260 [Candidatus Uhrbacteria bacterium]|nr:hypothetical protein [Candidatus Uhrbacteria bacterium]
MREHTTGVAQNPPLYFPRSAVIDAGLVTDFFRTHLSGRPLDMTTMREVLDAYAAALQEESLRATETEKAQRAAATAARVRQAEAEATLPEHRKP